MKNAVYKYTVEFYSDPESHYFPNELTDIPVSFRNLVDGRLITSDTSEHSITIL